MEETYSINTRGESDIKRAKKNLIKSLMFIPFFSIIILMLANFTDTRRDFIATVLLGAYILYPMIGLLLFWQKNKKVVRSLTINKYNILINTNKIYSYKKADIRFIRQTSQIEYMTKHGCNGIVMEFKDDKEFWIIEGYYNDFEKFKDSILKNNAS